MSRILRVTFGIIAAILALYGLITDQLKVMPFMYLFLGLMFLVMGITEYKDNKKIAAYIIFILAGFNLLGSIVAIGFP